MCYCLASATNGRGRDGSLLQSPLPFNGLGAEHVAMHEFNPLHLLLPHGLLFFFLFKECREGSDVQA